jgi:hypothetical protein
MIWVSILGGAVNLHRTPMLGLVLAQTAFAQGCATGLQPGISGFGGTLGMISAQQQKWATAGAGMMVTREMTRGNEKIVFFIASSQ